MIILVIITYIFLAAILAPPRGRCYTKKYKDTGIKLSALAPAPKPLPNNNIKIEIYETKR
jgi:hypothetical protein